MKRKRRNRRSPAAAVQINRQALRNADRADDALADAMHAICPAWSIDEMLCHPITAEKVARLALTNSGQRFVNEEQMARLLRRALNARKRGRVKRDRA